MMESADAAAAVNAYLEAPLRVKREPGEVNNEVDLSLVDRTECQLHVDISDALSEREKVKFTVHTKTSLPEFDKRDLSVIREHAEFIWLHDVIEGNPEYSGYMIPAAPPRPDFEASREKLTKLGEGESSLTKDEFAKMKKELEQEYLATFKKTVQQHEAFLQRLANHPKMFLDSNLRVFLQYDKDLNVRGRNVKEKFSAFFSRAKQSADEVFLTGQKDVDDFFEFERNHMAELYNHLAQCTRRSDDMTRAHKACADSTLRVCNHLEHMARETEKDARLVEQIHKVAATLELSRAIQAKVAADEDLKESDMLRLYMMDTQGAKDLLYRRLRCLANYESANKNLERARAKNKDVKRAEVEQQEAMLAFEDITALAKADLKQFKTRRVHAFKKYLNDLADLEIKSGKNHVRHLEEAIAALEQTKA